jgi:hypothetical protein
MSKKNRRQSPAVVKFGANKPTEFNPDYSQVKRDLARIGILAGSFVAALIILSFFQKQLLALFVK